MSVFNAHEAAAEVDAYANLAKKRNHFETEGLLFKVTIPSADVRLQQVQYQHYVDNKSELLEEIGFTLVSSEKVPGDRREDTLKVPGDFMKKLFADREKAHVELGIVPVHIQI
jgi:hypothetical protein